MRLAAVMFAVLTGVVVVCAQDRLQQAFERLDADGDGKVSREEAGQAAWFGRFGANQAIELDVSA